MPVETPARAEIRDRLHSAKPTSWIEAMVASINWRRRISSIPSFGIGTPCGGKLSSQLFCWELYWMINQKSTEPDNRLPAGRDLGSFAQSGAKGIGRESGKAVLAGGIGFGHLCGGSALADGAGGRAWLLSERAAGGSRLAGQRRPERP